MWPGPSESPGLEVTLGLYYSGEEDVTLSCHRLEYWIFCAPCQSVLSQVIGKFSIRIVPNQTPEEVESLTLKYLERRWSERKTPNRMRTWCDGDRGWLGDTNHINFQAGIRSCLFVCLSVFVTSSSNTLVMTSCYYLV